MKLIRLLLILFVAGSCNVKKSDDATTGVAKAIEEVRNYIELNIEGGESIKGDPDMSGSMLVSSDEYAFFFDYQGVRYTVSIENLQQTCQEASDSSQLIGKKLKATLRTDIKDDDMVIGISDDDNWTRMGTVELTIDKTAAGTTFMSESSRIVETSVTGSLQDKNGQSYTVSSGKIIFPFDKKYFGFEKVKEEE